MKPRQSSSWFLDLHMGTTSWAMTQFERAVAGNGVSVIAGVDEAGRGPLAGPIVAAAVILGEAVDGLNDSKLLDGSQREFLFEQLIEGPHRIGVGTVSHDTIDRRGLQWANYAAMATAVSELAPPPSFLLVDGFQIHGCPVPQKPVVKGDRRSLSIAAASIIAKVTRDRIMVDMAGRYPDYGFEQHKGYATAAHLEAIRKHGPCPIHRRSFAPLGSRLESGDLFEHEDVP